MTAVVGRVWSWVSPGNLYRPWGSKAKSDKTFTNEGQLKSRWSLGGVTSWVWGGQKNLSDQITPIEEFWDAEERHKPLEIEDLSAAETETVAPQKPPRWWSRMLPSAYFFWPRSSTGYSTVDGLRQRKCMGWSEASEKDFDTKDGELSDYGTPPPSPTPLSKKPSPFQLLARTWTGDILPEHYEICFNFLRHLFDLFVVGFLLTVSHPTRFILDVLGVQGPLKLWIHGMAMFLVSSVGMAGLLWLVQEYLPQFALVYGIVQALVISVSVGQSVILGTEDDEVDGTEEEEEEEDGNDDGQIGTRNSSKE
uniref:Si:ch73-25f10.6 n=1 Tax=Astyanax mexicanus TaxID=7994 RepID=A0A3B1IIN5_ASTMX